MEEEKIFYENLPGTSESPMLSENSESSENSENFGGPKNFENSGSSGNPENPESSENSENSESTGSTEKSEDSESRFRNFDAIATAFARGRGIPPEMQETTLRTIHRFAESIEAQEGAVDIFETIRKGLAYDEDVRRAADEGELKGRNTKIRDLYFREIPDDGLPHFNGSHAAVRKDAADTIFDLARQA